MRAGRGARAHQGRHQQRGGRRTAELAELCAGRHPCGRRTAGHAADRGARGGAERLLRAAGGHRAGAAQPQQPCERRGRRAGDAGLGARRTGVRRFGPQGSGAPIALAVGGVKLNNGRIDFSDRFIRPNYSANLTELNGSLGAFRTGSREMATLELRGRAAGTALLDVRGALNPTADPLALDIQAKATDLELAPLSPYAGKYAGYAIERGKLSMEVAYKIAPDGQLEARNQSSSTS
ncbi:DUF748 domain-containing protein [Piscinibacter aquaticus]|uniref:DUF748 domain-containing protein n=1 Tax=Piscinibacter aquaticus TaxID=392597 RepID=A0A5C6U1I8_9BURK|nr:DUF748 domain-containing protein [Piscinibacter aquaticus]